MTLLFWHYCSNFDVDERPFIGPGTENDDDDNDADDYNDDDDDERPSIGPGTPYPHPLHTGPTRGSRSAHFWQRIGILDATKSNPSPDGGFIYATSILSGNFDIQ